MAQEWGIGESAELKVPEKGYRYVEIVDFDGCRPVVRTSSGWEFSVNPDDLVEK